MDNILGTKTAVKILSCLLKNPQKEYKEIDLIKDSRVGKGAGADSIKKLHSVNILAIKRAGKTKIIRFNKLNPIAFNLRELFDQYRFLSLPENSISAVSLFRERVSSISKAIILFGSMAAGTHDKDSDIDLLIIIDDEKEIEKIRKINDEIHELIGEYINVHFLNSHDAKNEYKKNELIRSALLNGILVSGGDHVREIMKPPIDLKEIEFIKERINAAFRNYSNRDYVSTREIVIAVSQDLAFLVCRLEGIEVLSRKDAISKVKKINKYKIMSEIEALDVENMLEVLEDIYIEIINRTILRGECIER